MDYRIENGPVFTTLKINMAKGILSSIASGEGLICQYQDPGSIWIQTRNLPALANLINQFLPKQSN